MKVFIAIINHNHDEMIVSNPTLSSLAEQFTVTIKSNTVASTKLSRFCEKNNITLLQGQARKGFGENNNELFEYLKNQDRMTQNDYFLVLNPDVEVESEKVYHLLDEARKYDADISSINLFTDRSYNKHDNSIRYYPKLLSPIKSLLGISRIDIYDKGAIKTPKKIEWAAGSFLLFKVSCFESLKGFDKQYFMYFEDADICKRANKLGFKIYYFPKIKAVHYASHQNRNFFSKNFIWYCKSFLYYHLN